MGRKKNSSSAGFHSLLFCHVKRTTNEQELTLRRNRNWKRISIFFWAHHICHPPTQHTWEGVKSSLNQTKKTCRIVPALHYLSAVLSLTPVITILHLFPSAGNAISFRSALLSAEEGVRQGSYHPPDIYQEGKNRGNDLSSSAISINFDVVVFVHINHLGQAPMLAAQH